MANIMNVLLSNKKQLALKHYINGLKKESEYHCLKSLEEFKDIITKPQSNSFKDYTFDDLSADIAKLVENVEDDKKGAAESLEAEWSEEMEDINKCIDCYFYWATRGKNKDYSTFVCTKPHLLVYVQESEKDGSRWWPAKVLSINDDDTVTIECFGDYDRANYDFNQCILYCGTKNAKKSKNKKKKNQFERAFKQVAKYIENVKQKYANSAKQSFVPAPSQGQIITNMRQHLKEMFPAAYEPEDPTAPEDTKPQAPLANDQYSDSDDNDGTFVAAPHSSVSHGCGSRGYHSDDSNASVDAERAQHEFRILQIKSEYQQHDASAQSDIQSQAESMAVTRKRKHNSGVMKKPTAKRVASTQRGQVNAENEVITIDDDYERPSTSSQNHGQRNPTKSDGSSNVLVNELAEISGKIALHDQERKDLLAQQAIIMAKLQNLINTRNE